MRMVARSARRWLDGTVLWPVMKATAWIVATSVLLQFSPVAPAAEQAEEFLQGLNDRGLSELALHYLERMQTSPLADESFRRRIPYHRGVVLLEQSRQTVDAVERDKLLRQAEAELKQFAAANPGNVEGAEAQLQLGNMQLERGKQLVVHANKLPQESTYEAERKRLAAAARPQLAAARDTFGQAAAIYAAELEKLPPAAASGEADDSGNRRQEFRARVAQLRFLAAQTAFEAAETYSLGEEQFVAAHDAAAKELSVLFDEFARSPNALVGLYARLYEGRCYQAVAKYPLALGCYEDILAQPNLVPAFRKLIAAAVHRKAEVLIAQDKTGEAAAICRLCLQDATGDEQKLPEWLAVRFRLAEALMKQAAALPEGSVEQRRLQAEARGAYRVVAAVPGEFQLDARSTAAALSRNETSTVDEPRSFAEAYDLGKESLASYNVARQALPTAEQNNPSGVADLREQMRQGKADARRYFTMATSLVEDDPDIAALNEVRYFLCWLDWEAEDFYRSAVIGEFLARRYPDHSSARSAAKISMASFERLYRQAADAASGTAADTEFEARHMARMAEFITRRWPDSEDADAAFGVLVTYAIRTGRIDEAERLLNEAPPNSRPRLELQLGTAIWGRYLELTRAEGGGTPRAAMDSLRQSAEKYLRNGIESARGAGEVSALTATAALYLVQANLANGQHAQAAELLEDGETSPLILVQQRHSAARGSAYVIETYKAALRAYVLTSPPELDKAVELMAALEAAIRGNNGDGDDSSQMLTRIYVSLSVALQKQVAELRDAGRHDEADQLAAAIVQFLERVQTQQEGIDWPTRNWMAQTYYSLGMAGQAGPTAAAISPSYTKPTPIAGTQRDYLLKARVGYEQMLATSASSQPAAPNETASLATQLQLAECYRALGQYEDALNMLSAVLAKKESSLTVQRVAAYTYQDRGLVEDAKWLERAIHGGHRLRSTGENRIWGWLKIAQVASRNMQADKKLRDTFFEARLNTARCRYHAALKGEGAAQQQHLAKALQSIQSLAQLYPELGGEQWRGDFESLLKEIQAKLARSGGDTETN